MYYFFSGSTRKLIGPLLKDLVGEFPIESAQHISYNIKPSICRRMLHKFKSSKEEQKVFSHNLNDATIAVIKGICEDLDIIAEIRSIGALPPQLIVSKSKITKRVLKKVENMISSDDDVLRANKSTMFPALPKKIKNENAMLNAAKSLDLNDNFPLTAIIKDHKNTNKIDNFHRWIRPALPATDKNKNAALNTANTLGLNNYLPVTPITKIGKKMNELDDFFLPATNKNKNAVLYDDKASCEPLELNNNLPEIPIKRDSKTGNGNAEELAANLARFKFVWL